MLKKLLILTIIILTFTSCIKEKEKVSLVIEVDGKENIVEADIIYNHNDAVLFPAVVRSSGKKPVETEYKGIELKKLLETLNIDISNYKKAEFNASDGYKIILSIEEINEPSNVYLTFERDGEILKSKDSGGIGPFQLVIRRDPFSQRWIKHVNKIKLEV